MIYRFKNHIPVVHPTAYVHPLAAVTGDVIIGADVYIGPGAAIRGDWGRIIIEDGCNVQENCVIHMFPGITIRLEQAAHIGHGAIVHGAHIGRNVLVGMNAVIMDNAVIGDESIVGALSFVKADEVFGARSLIVGNPARKIKEVSDAMVAWKTEGTRLYQQLPRDLQEGLEACEPLTEVEAERPLATADYSTWNETQKSR
jgi:carbonic anhydrase/acetyltransferase-like protein (isoleucine patch superfamily)